MTEKYEKQPLTYDEQLDLLIERGLQVENRSKCVKTLSLVNYYRLSAYWYPFRIKDKTNNEISSSFHPDTTFEKIEELYNFDRKLRLVLLDAIERIEITFRTIITYHLAHSYGAFAHIKAKNFHESFEFDEWTDRLKSEIERSTEEFIKHYEKKYKGFPKIPIWMATEVMSMGTLSKLYFGLKNDDKKIVASQLNIHHKQLADWLHVLTYVRNVCSHHGRLLEHLQLLCTKVKLILEATMLCLVLMSY